MTPLFATDFLTDAQMKEHTAKTIAHFDAHFASKFSHPYIDRLPPTQQGTATTRLKAAWKRVYPILSKQHFDNITSDILEEELLGDTHYANLTAELMARVHFHLLDAGIEVAKIKNGMRVKTQTATPAVKAHVMKLIMDENLLSTTNEADTKLKIYQSIV